MLLKRKSAPATFWRAFFFGTALALAARGAVPVGSAPDLAQVGKPGPEEAARILAQFRRAGVIGEFFFEFELRALPRRGEERSFKGRLWGGRTARGNVFRVELADAAGVVQRLLIQNGEQASAWRLVDGQATELDMTALFAPLVPGVEVSAFDLQMPFLYWPDATLEKIARVFGRPAYAYLFQVPAELAARQTAIVAARAFLDTQFNALMQTELLGPTRRVVKTFALISLKKVADQYIPKQADYKNEITRDKTRFQVTAAVLNLRLPRTVFEPEALAQSLESPAAELWVRIDP